MAEPARKEALGPQLPLRLGRFVLCEELGAGGMATVFLAKMELAAGLDRLVALKTIHRHLAKQKSFVDMFLDEARIASQISHPNVCAVYDFGETDGTYYLAMEYLAGEPLFEVVNHLVAHVEDEEVLEMLPALAARIVADACEGLHAAHDAHGPNGEPLGIVHRDVSPQNLFVTYDGAVKVVDFGCAKAVERVAETSAGTLKGKVSYAAPEQLRNSAVDARADVWALGVCLWEALTLSSLFWRENPTLTAAAVLEEPIPLASKERSWVPEEVARIAAKALERDPRKRYASAREMGRDLRQFIARSGFTLESAELAEWMGFLFEERKKARLALVARAREVDPSKVGRTIEPIEPIATPSEPAPKPATEPRGEATAAPAPTPMPARVSLPDPEPARSRTRWPIALAVLLALGGGLYYAWWDRWFDLPFDLEAQPNEPRVAEPSAPVVDPSDSDPQDIERTAPAGGSRDPETQDREPPPGPPIASQSQVAAGPLDAGVRRDAGAGAGTRPDAGRRREREPPPVTTVVAQSGSSSGWPAQPMPSPSPSPSAPSPPSPAPSAPEAAVRTGPVRIEADAGWAMVYLGARLLGRTPIRTELPVGRHRLRILPYGREPADYQSIDVEPAFEVSLRISVADPATTLGAP